MQEQVTVDHDTVRFSVILVCRGDRTVPESFQTAETVWNSSGEFVGAYSLGVPNVVRISNSSGTVGRWVNLGTAIDSQAGQDVPTAGMP